MPECRKRIVYALAFGFAALLQWAAGTIRLSMSAATSSLNVVELIRQSFTNQWNEVGLNYLMGAIAFGCAAVLRLRTGVHWTGFR